MPAKKDDPANITLSEKVRASTKTEFEELKTAFQKSAKAAGKNAFGDDFIGALLKAYKDGSFLIDHPRYSHEAEAYGAAMRQGWDILVGAITTGDASKTAAEERAKRAEDRADDLDKDLREAREDIEQLKSEADKTGALSRSLEEAQKELATAAVAKAEMEAKLTAALPAVDQLSQVTAALEDATERAKAAHEAEEKAKAEVQELERSLAEANERAARAQEAKEVVEAENKRLGDLIESLVSKIGK